MYYLFGRGDGAGLIIKNFEFIECVCNFSYCTFETDFGGFGSNPTFSV